MALPWLLENLGRPSHVIICVSPIVLYWALSLYYVKTVPTKGSLPRPVWHIVRAVLMQQAIQLTLTIVTLPPDISFDFSLESIVSDSIPRFLLCALMFDTYEYWMHRWMHVNQWMYRHVHSVHHQLLDNRPYAALYNHWFEAFLMDTVGSVVAMSVSGLGPLGFAVFGCMATAKTVHDHVGVEPSKWDPFFILFSNNAQYHAVHHKLAGRKSNFSQPFFTIWDTLMDTRYDPKQIDRLERPAASTESSS